MDYYMFFVDNSSIYYNEYYWTSVVAHLLHSRHAYCFVEFSSEG